MADEQTVPAPERKEFSLKEIEGQLLQVEFQRHQIMLSTLLNYIAIERLAYRVDANTAFELSPDLRSIQIWQNPPAEEVTPEESETAKALKGKK